MKLPRLALCAALACALSACGDDRVAATPPVPPVELCVASGCGERVVLLELPSAENLTFTPGGRLFVSSGQGVFEVTKDPLTSAFAAAPVTAETCGGTGLVVRGNFLYAACGDGRLLAGEIGAHPNLVTIHQMTGMCIANGMALGADGNLYVVDEPLQVCVPDPKIKRLTISGSNPLQIVSEEVWVQGSPLGQLHLGLDNVLRFPNGLQSRGASFFGTDGGSVYRVDLQADGSAGPVTPLFWEPTAHDDLGVAGEDLLVTDFFEGRIFLMTQTGTVLQSTLPGVFSFPSSARLARPPMFAADDILVTETGVLGDDSLPADFLSLFRKRTAQQ